MGDNKKKKYKVVIYLQPYEYIVEATNKENAEAKVVSRGWPDTSEIHKIVVARYLA